MPKPRGYKTAQRRYMRMYFPSALLFAVLLFAGLFIANGETVSVWMRLACAFAVFLPLAGMVYAFWRHAEETEEYNRQVLWRAMAEATALWLALISFIGLLGTFEVIENFPVFFLFPSYFVAFAIACGRQNKDVVCSDEE